MAEPHSITLPDSSKAVIKPSMVNENAGRGLFAKCDLVPGDVIHHVSEPLAITPSQEIIEKVCAYCFEYTPELMLPHSLHLRGGTAKNFKRCARCLLVSYCSKECQINGWNTGFHKHECALWKHIRKQNTTFPDNMKRTAFRLMTQIALKFKVNGPDWKPWKDYCTLQYQPGDILGGEHRYRPETKTQFIYYAEMIDCFFGLSLDEMAIQKLVLRSVCNSHGAVYSLTEPVGSCVDPSLALVNHSCAYNAWVRFQGRQVSLIATDNIKKGEEITICYMPADRPREERLLDLKNRYFFDCRCKLCVSPEVTLTGDLQERQKKALEMSSIDCMAQEYGLLINVEKKRAIEKALNCLGSGWPVQVQPYRLYRQILASKAAKDGLWAEWVRHVKDLYTNVYPLPSWPSPYCPGKLRRLELDVFITKSLLVDHPPKYRSIEISVHRVLAGMITELQKRVAKTLGPTAPLTKLVDFEYTGQRDGNPAFLRPLYSLTAKTGF